MLESNSPCTPSASQSAWQSHTVSMPCAVTYVALPACVAPCLAPPPPSPGAPARPAGARRRKLTAFKYRSSHYHVSRCMTVDKMPQIASPTGREKQAHRWAGNQSCRSAPAVVCLTERLDARNLCRHVPDHKKIQWFSCCTGVVAPGGNSENPGAAAWF